MRRYVTRLGWAIISSGLVTVAVACGGGGADKTDSKTPANVSSSNDGSSGGAASESSTPSGSSSSSGGGTSGGTTTTELGDGGDLQGAKLGGKVHTETESKGESGPKSTRGQSANEPGRTAADIKTIIAVRRDEARACYDKALATHPGIEGDIDIKWVIDPQGNVNDAAIDTTKSQILEPSVANCIIDVIKRIKFAASAKGYETRAHYPFNFHPRNFTPKDAGK